MNTATAARPKDAALLIHVEHTKPIELTDFTTALNSVAGLYASYVKENGGSDAMAKSRLYVKKIEDGCIDIYLCELVSATLIPFLENANAVFGFADYVKRIVDFFCHRKGDKPALTVEKCNEIAGMFSMSVKDNAGNTSISAIDSANPSVGFYKCTFNFTESNSAQNQVRQEKDALLETRPNTRSFKRELMVVYQVRGDQSKDKGNKAVIESLSDKRLALLFDTDELKRDILFAEANPMTKGFLVDGEIFTVNNRDVAYKITALHDVIDLE